MNHHRQPRLRRLSSYATAAACAGLAVGCGGGSSSSSDAGGSPPTPASLTITGTAATGAALAGATIDLKCATGSGSATTAADGSYSASISGGALPCVARATSGSTVLHGASAASGSSARINLTPLTQLIVAQLALGEPATYFSGYGSSAAAALTASAVSGAQAAVVAKLKGGGVDFSAVADASGGPLAAKNGSTAGDAYDQLLDQMKAALAAGGTTLDALTTAYATEAAVIAGAAQSSGTASLPSELLLKPAAGNCAALRSGSYSFIMPTPGTPLAGQVGDLTVDALALTAVDASGEKSNLTPNGNCAYTSGAGTEQVMVSPAGIVVWRYPDSGTYRVAIGVPKQSHTLAELAGDWNHLNLENNDAGSGYTGAAGTTNFSASGAVTEKQNCHNESTWSIKTSDCGVPADGISAARVNAAGGFDVSGTSTGPAGARVFAYRAGNGELMLVGVKQSGSFGFYTHPRTNTLPTVGTTSTSWNVTIGQNLLAPSAVAANTVTTVSVDAAAGSYVRQAQTVGQSATRLETVMINSPRNGYNNRLAATVTDSAGATVNVSEWTVLTMRGMGISPLILPASKSFLISVTQP